MTVKAFPSLAYKRFVAGEVLTALLLTLIALFAFVLLRNVLPSVLQDELVYRQDATIRHQGAFALPNYLYFRIYGLSDILGDNFYQGVKALNVGFLLATSIFLLFWNRGRVHFWLRAFVSISYMGAPFIVFSSFHMPETLYGFLVVVALSVLMRAKFEDASNAKFLFGLAGVFLGLAALVKPHAMFVVLGVLIYLAVELLAGVRDGQKTNRILIFSGFFLASRLLVGFLTAGFQTFDFAGSYSDGLSGGQQGTGISLSVSIVMDLLGNLALNFGQHALVTTLFIAPVVYLIISRRAPLEGSLRFLLVVLFSVAFALAAFESYITVFSGDDHLSRVLMRHYEFLFPLIWLEGLRSLKEEARDAPKPFSVALSQFTFAIAFVGIGLTESVFWQASAFSDSGFTFAITEGGNWFFIAIGLLLISLFTIKFNPKGWLASALAALYFVGLGAFAIIGLFVGNSAPISSDSFALYLSTILDEDARVMVVGVDKPITEASVFLLNLPHADYEVFDDSASTIDPTEAIGVFDYVVPLGGLEIEDIGQGFLVTEWGKVSDLRDLSVRK